MTCPFQGSFVALPTPLRHDELDLAALHHLIEWHIEKRSDGIVVTNHHVIADF